MDIEKNTKTATMNATMSARNKLIVLPVYANYADAELNLMPNSYPELVFRSVIGVHFTNKKDGKCRCRNTHISLTQTLSGQRRAETDSIRPTACSVGLFCCPKNGGDI